MGEYRDALIVGENYLALVARKMKMTDAMA